MVKSVFKKSARGAAFVLFIFFDLCDAPFVPILRVTRVSTSLLLQPKHKAFSFVPTDVT